MSVNFVSGTRSDFQTQQSLSSFADGALGEFEVNNTINVNLNVALEVDESQFFSRRERLTHRLIRVILLIGSLTFLGMYIHTLETGYFFGFVMCLLSGLASLFFSIFRQLVVYQVVAERMDNLQRERGYKNSQNRIRCFEFEPTGVPPFRTRRLKAATTQKEVFDNCCICICEFKAGERLSMVVPCSHAFHRECLEEWLRSRGSCPYCNANLEVGSNPEPSSLSSRRRRTGAGISLLRLGPVAAGSSRNLPSRHTSSGHSISLRLPSTRARSELQPQRLRSARAWSQQPSAHDSSGDSPPPGPGAAAAAAAAPSALGVPGPPFEGATPAQQEGLRPRLIIGRQEERGLLPSKIEEEAEAKEMGIGSPSSYASAGAFTYSLDRRSDLATVRSQEPLDLGKSNEGRLGSSMEDRSDEELGCSSTAHSFDPRLGRTLSSAASAWLEGGGGGGGSPARASPLAPAAAAAAGGGGARSRLAASWGRARSRTGSRARSRPRSRARSRTGSGAGGAPRGAGGGFDALHELEMGDLASLCPDELEQLQDPPPPGFGRLAAAAAAVSGGRREGEQGGGPRRGAVAPLLGAVGPRERDGGGRFKDEAGAAAAAAAAPAHG